MSWFARWAGRLRNLDGDCPVDSPLDILHEDAECLAVVKPAGQFTQGTWAPPGEMTLEEAIRRYLGPDDPGAVYLGIVHRLDRPTSGVLIWAKTPKAARRLSAQFEQPTRRQGILGARRFRPRSGIRRRRDLVRLADPTRPDGARSPAPPETPGARPAVTRVRREAASKVPAGTAWLRLWPETGRTHQLRAQAAARGSPILGDSEYGSTTAVRPARDRAPRPIARDPASDPPDADDARRADPACMGAARLRPVRRRLTVGSSPG